MLAFQKKRHHIVLGRCARCDSAVLTNTWGRLSDRCQPTTILMTLAVRCWSGHKRSSLDFQAVAGGDNDHKGGMASSPALGHTLGRMLAAARYNTLGRERQADRIRLGNAGEQGLLGMWLVFAPGAVVVGALSGSLLLWVGRRVRSQVALHRRGLAWGSGLGLLVGLLGLMFLLTLVPGKGTEWSWWELGETLLIAPVEHPRLLGGYYAMMGAHTRTEAEH